MGDSGDVVWLGKPSPSSLCDSSRRGLVWKPRASLISGTIASTAGCVRSHQTGRPVPRREPIVRDVALRGWRGSPSRSENASPLRRGRDPQRARVHERRVRPTRVGYSAAPCPKHRCSSITIYFDLIHKQAVTLETKRQGKTLGDRRGGRGGSEASVCARGRRACRMPSCVRARAAPSRAPLPPRATPSLPLPSRSDTHASIGVRSNIKPRLARLQETPRDDPTTKRRQLVRLGRLNTTRARPSTVSLVSVWVRRATAAGG